jgi:hypothetical protein
MVVLRQGDTDSNHVGRTQSAFENWSQVRRLDKSYPIVLMDVVDEQVLLRLLHKIMAVDGLLMAC